MFTPFYSRWWKELGLTPLAESKADCVRCTMVHPPHNETTRDPGPFDPKLKCCTYSPYVPNFSVGEILKSENYREAFERGLVSPLGLFPPRAESASRLGFGTDANQRCAFLSRETASCTIWASRPSVCASYFCVSSKGSSGQSFWATSEKFGNLFEWTLAHEILWRLGFNEKETEQMALAAESGDKAAVDESWFEWRGRELELFRRTLDEALTISAGDIRESMGAEGEALIRELRCATP
jgi:Fe-S-cluster containining protein